MTKKKLIISTTGAHQTKSKITAKNATTDKDVKPNFRLSDNFEELDPFKNLHWSMKL